MLTGGNMIIRKLFSLGQSLWYDNIQRRLLENGELAAMIARGEIRGVTSNPSIFLNAIAKTKDYDPALVPLAWSGWEAEQIFWQLAIEDIREACDLFSPLYRESEAADGYVSLEVSPVLAHNTAGSLAQAKQLWEWVDRPNLMIKIPATPEGIPAVRAAIAAGINVNVTLIFSLERYRAVMEAYLTGLDERLKAGLEIRQIASVASFFVSRMDTKVDALLDALVSEKAKSLRGKAAIAYTKLAYEEFLRVFRGEHFARYKAAGGSVQRPLWASTSTKNPAYPDTMYVDSLVGPGTVNTVPPQTLEAFLDHGKAEVTILDNLDGARQNSLRPRNPGHLNGQSDGGARSRRCEILLGGIYRHAAGDRRTAFCSSGSTRIIGCAGQAPGRSPNCGGSSRPVVVARPIPMDG